MNAHLHTPDDPRVFVFGSNLMGIHGAGAAHYAYMKLGAQYGVCEGPTGRAYALPTCLRPGVPRPLRAIACSVNAFLEHASMFLEHASGLLSGITFFVSAIGCGFAGYTEAEIAPLFRGAPANCDLPPGWRA